VLWWGVKGGDAGVRLDLMGEGGGGWDVGGPKGGQFCSLKPPACAWQAGGRNEAKMTRAAVFFLISFSLLLGVGMGAGDELVIDLWGTAFGHSARRGRPGEGELKPTKTGLSCPGVLPACAAGPEPRIPM